MNRLYRWMLVLVLPLLFLLASASPVHATSPAPALHVSGSTIRDAANNVVRLHGVNFSGAEYSCVTSGSIWDSSAMPSTAMLNSLLASHVNAVRIPLNEDCWLGVNGVSPSVSGVNYQSAIESWVSQLQNAGITPILDLHWSAPGSHLATGQKPMMDAHNSGPFWKSVATVYKSDQAVIFDLYNEPYVQSFNCWLNGRTACTTADAHFTVLGMQEATNDVRSMGANNVIMLGCLDFANTCSSSSYGSWWNYVPVDAAHNLVASVHIYGKNPCTTANCWSAEYAPILAAGYPVLNGEFGDYNYDDTGVNQAFATSIMDWFDSNGTSGYTAWAWDNWGTVEALICADDGSCLTTWGQYMTSQYAARFP